MAAFVAENCTAQGNTGSSLSTTTGRQIDGTEHVVVTIKAQAGAGAVTSVSVGALTLYPDVGSVGGTMASEIWSAPANGTVITSGATVTVNWTNAGAFTFAFVCMSLSGVPVSGYLRASSSATGTSQNPGPGTMTGNVGVIPQAADLVVTTYALSVVLGATPPAGETQQTELSSGTDIMETGQGALTAPVTSVNPLWTAGSNTSSWQSTGVVYANNLTAAFVRQGGTNASKASPASIAATVPAAGHAIGNLVVVVVGYVGTAAGAGTVTDSRSNTYTLVSNTGGTLKSLIFACVLKTALVSGDSITFTLASSTKMAIGCLEFSGVTVTADVAATTSQGTTAGVENQTPLISPPTVGDLVIAAIKLEEDFTTSHSNTNIGTALPATWQPGTVAGTTGGSSAANIALDMAYKIITALGTTEWSIQGTTHTTDSNIVSLQFAPAPIVQPLAPHRMPQGA